MLPIIPHDKANHLAYGAFIAFVGLFHSSLMAAVLTVTFAVLKEAHDRVTKKGTPEAMDIVATLVGGGLVIAHWFLPFA